MQFILSCKWIEQIKLIHIDTDYCLFRYVACFIGSFYHPYFVKDRRYLCHLITRPSKILSEHSHACCTRKKKVLRTKKKSPEPCLSKGGGRRDCNFHQKRGPFRPGKTTAGYGSGDVMKTLVSQGSNPETAASLIGVEVSQPRKSGEYVVDFKSRSKNRSKGAVGTLRGFTVSEEEENNTSRVRVKNELSDPPQSQSRSPSVPSFLFENECKTALVEKGVHHNFDTQRSSQKQTKVTGDSDSTSEVFQSVMDDSEPMGRESFFDCDVKETSPFLSSLLDDNEDTMTKALQDDHDNTALATKPSSCLPSFVQQEEEPKTYSKDQEASDALQHDGSVGMKFLHQEYQKYCSRDSYHRHSKKISLSDGAISTKASPFCYYLSRLTASPPGSSTNPSSWMADHGKLLEEFASKLVKDIFHHEATAETMKVDESDDEHTVTVPVGGSTSSGKLLHPPSRSVDFAYGIESEIISIFSNNRK